MPTLPIAVESRIVHVPCALPAEFQVGVYIPGRGVQGFFVELSSRNPALVRVLQVDSDGPLLTDEWASKVDSSVNACLADILRRLGLDPVTREPNSELAEKDARILSLIAKAQDGEQAAKDSSEEANALLPGFAQIDVRGDSRAVSLLNAYIDSVIDAVQAEQEDRAEAEAAGHGLHASP